jgi:hypothetical protein
MKTSETIVEISKALIESQSNIRYAFENSVNPHLKNRYADLSSVIDAIKPHLNRNNIAFVQMPEESEVGIVRLTTRLIHNSGEWIETTSSCPMPKNDPQGYGSALTYLRRYSLSAICGLYADDDDGEMASKPSQTIDIDYYVKSIKESTSLDDLKTRYTAAIKMIAGNPLATKVLEKAKDEMKGKLNG